MDNFKKLIEPSYGSFKKFWLIEPSYGPFKKLVDRAFLWIIFLKFCR